MTAYLLKLNLLYLPALCVLLGWWLRGWSERRETRRQLRLVLQRIEEEKRARDEWEEFDEVLG